MSSFQVEFPPYFVDEKPREIITQAYGFEVGFIFSLTGSICCYMRSCCIDLKQRFQRNVVFKRGKHKPWRERPRRRIKNKHRAWIKDDISLYSKLEVHLHTYVVNLCCRLCHEPSLRYRKHAGTITFITFIHLIIPRDHIKYVYGFGYMIRINLKKYYIFRKLRFELVFFLLRKIISNDFYHSF